MTLLRLFLVDDEHSATRRLAPAREGIEDVAILGALNDGEETPEKLSAANDGIVFLDSKTPRRNGVEFARRLRRHSTAKIIFVTALTESAVEAFDLEAAEYGLKPVQNDGIAEAFVRARRRITETNLAREKTTAPHALDDEHKALWIPKGNSKVRVFIDDIVRVEASKDYALIYTSNNTFILRSTMKHLAERFDSTSIARVHRSAFLNLNLVLKAEYTGRRLSRLHTEDGAVVEVSTRYSRNVEELIGAR
jgi:two-component system, LytTR family, response regulator